MADMTLQQVQQNPMLNALLAPYIQPGAQLGETQAQIPQIQQSTATSAQEQQNLQAQNPGIQAQAQTQQVQALQSKAKLGLTADLHNGITLGSAMNKYKALGMNADDIFNQYVSQSPYGYPKESPIDLHNMGVSEKIIGQPGQAYTYADRYNTRSALNEINTMQNIWNNTSFPEKLAGEAGMSDNVRNYKQAQTIVGEHLSSLIPGGSNAQGSVDQLMSTLPSINDLRISKESGNQLFNQAKTLLMQQKGYSPKDLGLEPGQQSQQQASGKQLLSTVTTKAIDGINNGGNGRQGLIDLLQGNPGKAVSDIVGNNPKAILSNVLGAQKDVGVSGFNNALATTAIGSGIGSGLSKIFGAGTPIAEKTLANAPGGIKQLLQPGQAMKTVGQIRDNIITAADKTGVKINGNDVAQSIRSWANTAKLSNLPDADAIEEAAAKAEQLYKDQTFTPSGIKKIYDGIEKGFTTTSQPKSSTASYIDRGLKSVISDHLDQVAPGFKQTSQLFDSIFNAQKSPLRAGVKNAAKYVLPLAVGQAGGDILNHAIFGQ